MPVRERAPPGRSWRVTDRVLPRVEDCKRSRRPTERAAGRGQAGHQGEADLQGAPGGFTREWGLGAYPAPPPAPRATVRRVCRSLATSPEKRTGCGSIFGSAVKIGTPGVVRVARRDFTCSSARVCHGFRSKPRHARDRGSMFPPWTAHRRIRRFIPHTDTSCQNTTSRQGPEDLTIIGVLEPVVGPRVRGLLGHRDLAAPDSGASSPS